MYLAQRHLHLSEDQWDALPWDRQRMFFEGMAAEGLVTAEPDMPEEGGEPVFIQRKADTGGGVIDLQQMIRESRGA